MKRVKWVIGLVTLLVLAWVLRPWLHGFVMGLWVNPLSLIFFIVLIGGIVSMLRRLSPKMVKTGPASFVMKAGNQVPAGIIVLYVAILGVLLFMLALQYDFRYKITAEEVKYEKRSDLPEFSPVRLTPKQVATRYADDSFQNPQEHLGDSQIVLIDGKLQRVSPRLPDGGILYFVKKLSGFVTVEVDTLERKVQISDQEFKYSEGVGIFDNIYFQLPKHKYFVDYSSEPIYLKDDAGQWVTVVPYMTYKGFPFRIPQWGGVAVVKSDGTINYYTPDEATNISYLKGNRIYPKELVNYYTDAYSYGKGILNQWFLHKDQIEIVNLPGEDRIIHASTPEGFKQVVVAEPYGRSYGIYKIFIFDATTGKREVIEYDQNSQLTGPASAADYIKKEFPTYDWTGFTLAESRPIKISGELYWLMSVVPNDHAGIAKTVLLNAKTNKVTGIDTEDQLKTLIAGGTVAATSTTSTPTNKQDEIKAKINAIQGQLDELKKLVQ